MSDLPLIADLKPAEVRLDKGEEYAYCACGRSATQPFCDGSHAGTRITPKMFRAEADGAAHLCQCKQTGNPPYCDGTHAKVPKDKKGNTWRPSHEGDGRDAPAVSPTPEEPTVAVIHELARNGLATTGPHGPVAAMGVPRPQLPSWDDLQLVVAELAGVRFAGA